MYQTLKKIIYANNRIESFLFFLFSTILFLFIGFDVVNTCTSICHSAEALNMYDNQVLCNDLDVIASQNVISPRMGGNLLYLLFLKTGFTYAEVNILLFIVSAIILGKCVSFIVSKEKFFYPYFFVLILTLLIGYTKIGVYANFGIFDTQNPTMCLATSLSILAITFAIYNKELSNISYIMIILASVIHIHEGIYGFIIVSIILYFHLRNRLFVKLGIYLSILTLLALTLPNLLESHNVLTPSEFYQIYVRWRTPHHLYFFNYGYTPHILMFLSYFSIFLLARNKEIIKKEQRLYIFFILCFLAVAFTWYVSYEIMQCKFFIKMYLPKMVKYISFVFTLLMVKAISDDVYRGYRYPVLFFTINLFFTPFIFQSLTSLAYCVIVLTIMSFIPQKYKYKNTLWILCIMLTLYVFLAKETYNFRYIVYMCGIMFIILLGIKSTIERVVLILMLFPLINLKVSLKTLIRTPHAFVENTIRNHASEELYEVSKYIHKTTSNNSIILCDAFDKKGAYIQHISKRPVYADWGTLPSSEEGVREWAKRCKNIESLSSWSPEQLHSFMKKNNIELVVFEKENPNVSLSPLFSLEYSNEKYNLYSMVLE